MLWEHFGYRRNPAGVVEEDGAPFCKLCLRKLVSRGEMTRNMKQHLKENHNTVYAEPEVQSLGPVPPHPTVCLDVASRSKRYYCININVFIAPVRGSSGMFRTPPSVLLTGSTELIRLGAGHGHFGPSSPDPQGEISCVEVFRLPKRRGGVGSERRLSHLQTLPEESVG